MNKKNWVSTIVFLCIIFFLWQILESNRHHWKTGVIQSKGLNSSGNTEFLVELPETVALVEVSSKVSNSIKVKDRICVEYSRNSTTKEVKVFSYSTSSKCQTKQW
jgi:hypothetical protein